MYKETNSKSVGGISIIIDFVLLVVALRIVLSILPVFQLLKDIAYMAVLVAFVFILIKRYMCTYEYELTEDELVITTQLGGRERARAQIPYIAVECFLPADDEKIKSYNARTQTLCTHTDNKYAVVFNAADGKVKVIFAPSEKMISLIENKLYSAAQGGLKN